MYSIAIIEDNLQDYRIVKEKIALLNNLVFVDKIEVITMDTPFLEYCNKLLNHTADIYIVDWELEFRRGTSTPREIFEYLSQKKFDFMNKYWIFYSGKEEFQASALLSEYFPLNYNYLMPGKTHILGKHKSERNYLKECIDEAIGFFEKKSSPSWISTINFQTEIILENYNGKCYDLQYQICDKNKLHALAVFSEAVICMSNDDPLAILLFIGKEKKNLQLYLFRFNSEAKKVSDALNLVSTRGFRYNPKFFNNKLLINDFREYINQNAKILYGSFSDPQNPENPEKKLDLSKQLKIFKRHKVLN